MKTFGLKSSKLGLGLLACALVLGNFGCGTPAPTVVVEIPFIAPPIPALAPKFQAFVVDNEKPRLIELANGGTIKLQPNSIVDTTGAPIKGTVEVLYREYHNSVDVMLSGIPMNYNEGGQVGHFQTAGMFEIRAEKDKKALQLDPKKPALVRMASYEMGDDYDFFELVEKGREGWRKRGHSQPEINISKKNKIDKINSQLKTAFQIDKKMFVFCFDAVIDATFKNDRTKIQEQGASVSKTKAQKYGIDELAIHGHQYLTYKGARYGSSLLLWKNLGKSFPDWLRDEKKVYQFTLTQVSESVYDMSVTHVDKAQVFQSKIEIVMPLASFFAFSPEHWANNYEDAYAKVQAEIERLRTEADAFRSFEVAGMGIYNYDKLMNETDAIITKADFKVEGVGNEASANAAFNLDMVFYFADDKTLIKLDKASWNKVALLPNAEKARFVVVLPNDGIGIFSVEDYRKIDFAALKKEATPTYTFQLMKKIDKLTAAEDLSKALGI
jgi:hypothetical protein